MRFRDIMPTPKELADAVIANYRDRWGHLFDYEKAQHYREEKGIIAVGFCGPSRAGKDTAAEIWSRITGYRLSKSLSWAGIEFMYEALPDQFEIEGVLKTSTAIKEAIYENRHLHDNTFFLKEFFDTMRETDPLILVRKVLTHGDTVTGTRHKIEHQAYYPDYVQEIVWIDRDVPPDPTLDYTKDDVSNVILNDSSLEVLEERLKGLFDIFARKHNLATKGS